MEVVIEGTIPISLFRVSHFRVKNNVLLSNVLAGIPLHIVH